MHENSGIISQHLSKTKFNYEPDCLNKTSITKESSISTSGCGTSMDNGFDILPLNSEKHCCWFCFRVISIQTAFKDKLIRNKYFCSNDCIDKYTSYNYVI